MNTSVVDMFYPWVEIPGYEKQSPVGTTCVRPTLQKWERGLGVRAIVLSLVVTPSCER